MISSRNQHGVLRVSAVAFVAMITTASMSMAADDETTASKASSGDAQPSVKLTDEQLEFFETKIRPVLVSKCYECHATDSKKENGGLFLDTRAGLLAGGESGPVIVSGDPGSSELLAALKYESFEMPPSGKLPAAVIADFEQWIRMGAPDPRDGSPVARKTGVDYEAGLQFWAFQKPVAQDAPAVPSGYESFVAGDSVGDGAAHTIDRFIVSKLHDSKLTPMAAADRRTLIRRATFDLIGLPPEPAAIDRFVSDPDDDVTAFARVVDELLASPHYGERWGRYWLDVARYGEDQAHTFKARRYPQGYLYRDWVVQALNDDMPYDRFLTTQIAGDLHDEPGQHERLAALGLFALGPVYYQDNGEKDKALADEWDDRVDTVIRGTQALTIACARCHDHKYDPLSMADYYGLIGIFASSDYQERPAVPDEVVQARQRADAAVNEQQLEINRFLVEQSRAVRETLIDAIPDYVVAAWQVVNRRRAEDKPNEKKLVEAAAKQSKLNEALLQRWVAWLDARPESGAVKSERPWFAAIRQRLEAEAKDGSKDSLADDADAQQAVREIGIDLQRQVSAALPRRTALFRTFGENSAFVAAGETADVLPGQIPLGNLFDDAEGTSLNSALATDRFKATASEKSLGVARVAQGWGRGTSIAKGIQFNFDAIGSGDHAYGAVINDAWFTQGGIRTEGKNASASLPRTEQGIGMHANALVTFDLDQIRQAGLIPADQPLKFVSDRAGLNDDVIGSNASAYLAVIVSRPHQKENTFDAIVSCHLNGQPAQIDENDQEYYIAGTLPDPLRGDGTLVKFDVELPPDAKYLTLVATGAGMPDDNPISSDHVVFSGARIEYEPPAEALAAAAAASGQTADKDSEDDRRAATLLSEMLADQGLLAIPADAVGPLLSGDAATQLKDRQTTLEQKKQAAGAIEVVMAHALKDGSGQDFPIYLSGDPTKKGDLAPRAFPAVFTDGQRTPFEPQGSGRKELAEAIASRDNPLTARVIVNRVWAGHFGAGLVRTLNNFGQLGERPTHPELLDWLAVRFMNNGWSLKTLHRDIMLSAAYRRSSAFDAAAFETDPDNRLLWRMNRRRLEVEPWRDALLAVSGKLDRTAGGRSMNLDDANNRRRTLYGFISRHELNDLLRLFDFPDPNITAGSRTVTTVPLQQLFVLNSEFMINQSRALATRIVEDVPTPADATSPGVMSQVNAERVAHTYLLLFGRPPTDAERELAVEFLNSASTGDGTSLAAWEQYALALLGSNEFVFVD